MSIDIMNGDNSLRQSEAAIDELLTVFLAKAEPTTRKLADEVYERFLYSVQEYLRDNAAWNLSNEIDRCRRVEAGNRAMSKALTIITEMDGDQPARSAWDMVRIARSALGDAT